MIIGSSLKTVQLTVRFANRNLLKPLIEGLSRDPNLTVNILSGRITESDATFALEISGPAARVDEIVQLGKTWAGTYHEEASSAV